MNHVTPAESSTAAFRARRRFLSMIMQEKEFIDYGRIQNAVLEYHNYQSESMKKVINFIIPLSGR